MIMLHYNTINELLKETLFKLMAAEPFNFFRLVGGTSLSLQLGHRISVDIDLFTDAPYGSVNFDALEYFLNNTFPYVSHLANVLPGMGKSYTVGVDRNHAIKIDVYYTDIFIQPALIIDGIRMATIEEIIAMKIDVIQRGGRKKDFWDLHELLPKYGIRTMLALHKQRYEFGHDPNLILKNLTDFTQADDDFNPICLRGKYWVFIREDIEDAVKDLGANY
ncbi:nucleotidyl transferase AbiEii/AbiGii toxin family protein [Dyadobacter sp. LJ53]|uniref:nucleotidyl transferase AbiEii/AbiGii toxin family protein n=1 Tax=Dyadobacter chenwenxiniae TaxID=2906456 RepID=UPI001F26B5BD|nr:nucleotidyl transferase AbiEii/AbiGii toxin family protein [Dyadobacter chenwenxiniae]MCF0051117.1 nucleotidyl transferase AbiEii/AbiGii toxin family protein [Dyadobacter chenwenxiniae]